MVAVIIFGLIILLIISTFLFQKKTISDKYKTVGKTKKILAITALCIFIFVIINTLMTNGIRSFYCLSDDKCVTVWKQGDGETYIIFGEYKSKKDPPDNYIKTSYNNALTIIIDESSNYDYIISNNYGKSILIKSSNFKIKYYEYNQRENFINDYYINRKIKKSLKYLQIDIKENLIVLNGVKL